MKIIKTKRKVLNQKYCQRSMEKELSREISFTLPEGWEENWERLLKLYNKNESDLVLDLIKDEVTLILAKKQKNSYERMENAARQVYDALGAEGLDQFSREIELVAKKLVETVEGQ